MLSIALGVPAGRVTYVESEKAKKRRLKAEKAQQKVSSLATTRGAPISRELPWPQFLAALQNKRDQVVRGHIRWCMRTAIRNCETLRRTSGRAYELRPGGQHNVVSSGSMWHEGRNGPERMGSNDAKILLESGRYVNELDDNLRKLLCPPWAIGVVKRAIRAKLALGWDLEANEGNQ